MKRFALIVALFIIGGGTLPAFAKNQTHVSLTALTPQYSGPCPVTVKFSVTITGEPGDQIQYQFVHVRSWKQGAANYGFVFRPDKEGDQNDATVQEGCWTISTT